MRTHFGAQSGQLLVPMAGLLVVLGIFCVGYVRWCRAIYWRTRMEMTADAAALSAARAQAQMLNRVSTANTMVNGYVRKMRVPYTNHQLGEMGAEKYPEFRLKAKELAAQVWGFKTFPAAVGQIVARANGAEGMSPYFPFPMNSLLVPKAVHLIVHSKIPPYLWFRTVEGAYYARVWSPPSRKAQPPHRTTWLVKGHGFQAMATARLWLDVPLSSGMHNGGFPRVRESIGGDLLIQSWLPQFSARLAPRPRMTPLGLRDLWDRSRGTFDEG